MSDQLVCPTCGVFLAEPYIKCLQCKDPPRAFCVRCFAKGQEYKNHVNSHPYIVMRNNFTLFENWKSCEEMKLLDAISECGLGNWSSVSKAVGTRSKAECESHYYLHYIYKGKPPLPAVPEPAVEEGIHSSPVLCTATHDPPRSAVGSTPFCEMAGYMPRRGDFSVEFDDFAEIDVKSLDLVEEKDPLLLELQKAVLSNLSMRLKERARRKSIIKEYGLISSSKITEQWKRYEMLGKPVLDKMKALMRLQKPSEFSDFMEGILYEEKLKRRIKLLQECRAAGIRKLQDASVYLKLKKKQEQCQKSRTLLDDVLTHVKDGESRNSSVRKQVLKEKEKENSPMLVSPSVASSSSRRSAPPLTIMGLPECEKLTAKEKDLCAKLRLYPNLFLQYKAILIHECEKLGSLRLAQARAVIKIDVNKTRKIFDFLEKEGVICKGT